MLIQAILLGGGLAAYMRRQQGSSVNRPGAGMQNEKKGVSLKLLLKDFKSSVLGDERQQLQMSLDSQAQHEIEKFKREANRNLVISAAATGFALLSSVSVVFVLLAVGAIYYLARDVLLQVYRDMRRGHILSVYLLSMILLTGMILKGHLILAAISGLFGGLLMKIIKSVEDNSQQHLVDIFSGHPPKVWVEKDGLEILLDFNELKKGDIVIVNAGEIIPVDGEIRDGMASIDQRLLTGESQPVERSRGDKVFASTTLLSGRIAVIVETAGNDTLAAGIGQLLHNTQHYKDNVMARGQKLADAFLPWEIGVCTLTFIMLGSNSALAALWSGLGSNMAILGPLSVLNYLQILSRQGILVKDGRVFESLRQVDTIVFDKTGTLTLEQPSVGAIHAFENFTEEEVLRLAATAEFRQSHPIAKAIVARAETEGMTLGEIEDASYDIGFGIQVTLEGRKVLVGSIRFMELKSVVMPEHIGLLQQQADELGYSMVYLAVDDRLAGMLEMHPTIRPEAKEVLAFLKKRGLDIYIISGDHERPTRHMASLLGIEHYFSEVLPENKADLVQQLRDDGKFVCFVGDGINDAIALKSAQVSISLKGASSAATDTAQIVFMEQSLNKMPTIFELSDEFEQTMNSNLVGSVMPGMINIACIYLLHTGIAMGMTIFYLGSLIALGNTLLPLARHQHEGLQSPVEESAGELPAKESETGSANVS